MGTRDDEVEAGESDSVLAEWAAEVADKLEAGETISPEAYSCRDQGRAERLKPLLPVLAMMAGMRARPDSNVDPPVPSGGLGEIGDFRLVREIGGGAMGVVYEAVQISLGRRVALKVLRGEWAGDPARVARFRLEAHAVASLHHGHIVPIHVVGPEPGVPYYAMELIEGGTLADVIRDLRASAGRTAAAAGG